MFPRPPEVHVHRNTQTCIHTHALHSHRVGAPVTLLHQHCVEKRTWKGGKIDFATAVYTFGAFGAVSLPLTSHHKQLSCLTLRVSHRAWIEPGEWLNTKPSTSPRRATPTHAGRWGSAWRPPPDLLFYYFLETYQTKGAKKISPMWDSNSGPLVAQPED